MAERIPVKDMRAGSSPALTAKGEIMKKIHIYIHTKHEHGKDIPDCMCLASNRGCEYDCEKQFVIYDEHQDMLECFMNKGKKDYE